MLACSPHPRPPAYVDDSRRFMDAPSCRTSPRAGGHHGHRHHRDPGDGDWGLWDGLETGGEVLEAIGGAVTASLSQVLSGMRVALCIGWVNSGLECLFGGIGTMRISFDNCLVVAWRARSTANEVKQGRP